MAARDWKPLAQRTNEGNMAKDTYRILEFSAENFKRLRMVGFRPKSRVTMLTGKNDQGKSSVLDAVGYAFGGAKAAPDMPIRKGAKTMEIMLDLGRLIVRRTGNRLEVTPAKGEKAWDTPQKMLNSIYDELAFNPQEFALMKAEDQAEALRKLSGVDEELKRLDGLNAVDYETRKGINAEIRGLQAEIGGMVVQDRLPKEKIDEEAIRARKREAAEANRNIIAAIETRVRLTEELRQAEEIETQHMQLMHDEAEKIGKLEAFEKDAEEMDLWLQDVEIKLGDLLRPVPTATTCLLAHMIENSLYEIQRDIPAARDSVRRSKAQRVEELRSARLVLKAAEDTEQSVHQNVIGKRAVLDAAPKGEMIDTLALDEELEAAQLTNREIDKRAKREALEKQLADKQRESSQLTRTMEDREEEKRTAIAEAKMPLEGLTVTDSQVLLNGIPVKQLGEARQIMLGVSIGIARDPALRLVLIPHGEALDEEALAQLEKMAEEKDFYVWMAKVDSSGKLGIYIEDGMVKENNEE